MALTRKFLKALGIEDEKIDEIITAHSDTVEALKEQRDSYEADAKKLPTVQRELDELKENAKNDDSEEWKDKYTKLKKDFDDYKIDIQNKETMAAKKSALEELAKDFLSENGVAKAVKYADWDAYELDEKGKLTDAKKHIKDLKEEWSDYVLKEDTKGANTTTPPTGAGGGQPLRMEEIYKKDERGKYVMDSLQRQEAIAKLITEGDE